MGTLDLDCRPVGLSVGRGTVVGRQWDDEVPFGAAEGTPKERNVGKGRDETAAQREGRRAGG